MLISYKRSQTSIVLRVKILNSSVSTGAGLTGLTSASAGLIISTIADNEATAVAYTQAGSTIESITTLGTYAAPTATKCRFKEVDATNHKGIYEIQLADTRFAGGKSLLVSISGATNCAETDACVPLTDFDPYDTVRAGLTALPNAAAAAAGGLWILGSNNTAAITIGNLTMSALACTTITASGAVAFQSTFAVTTSTSLGAISGTTVTFSGAVAFQSTFAVTTSTSFAALSATTITASGTTSLAAVTTSGTVTFNAFTVTNAFTVSGATTHTGAFTATHASNDIKGITVAALANNVITAASINAGALVAAVWDGAISGHTGAGSFGAALNAAGSAGDPWVTPLPGAYGAGTAGYIVGNGIPANTVIGAAIQAKTDLINTATFWAGAFTINTTKVYADAVANSVVKVIASNAVGSGGTVGPGSISFTVTINDDMANPLDGAEVWVSTDEVGSNVIAGTLNTNAMGQATFLLNAGSYWLWVNHSGYNRDNPTSITVTA